MKIVFMGTPDFAVPSLEALAASGHEIPLVVTQPDRPRGRGQKVQPPPVKARAVELGLRVAQPERIKRNEDFFRQLAEIKPDLIVVAAYGKILPGEIIALPAYGCVNIHASLLPKYRGAAPIHRAVEAGEEVTGVTLMLMSEGLDEGDILDARAVEIGESDTGRLHDLLARAGAELLAADLDDLLAGRIRPVPQDGALATYAPPVEKSEGQVDFSADADRIVRKIRAMNPFPGAYAFLNSAKFKIRAARRAAVPGDGVRPGTVVFADKSGIGVAAGDGGVVVLDRVQLSGGRELAAADFLRGYELPPGTVLEWN
ncbi:MAG: methionyl-tRNA formyltransferase [Clostridiales Family XIII bacterium]|jgi:methionyl-tRNA formyltransferase|nr:methionyl-tRNA formyltransferase [Clostridiales Family XIII bacterium]